MLLEKINDSFLYYNPSQQPMISDYFFHFINSLKKFLEVKPNPINIIVGPHVWGESNYVDISNFDNQNKVIKINFQLEHFIVQNENHNFTIKNEWFNPYYDFDYIVEYSLPNIHHISLMSNDLANKNYLEKTIHIFPNYNTLNFLKKNRSRIISTFSSWSTRRANIFNTIKENNIDFSNVIDCYKKECLMDVYDKTKIMINVHQTDFHKTIEELRILPALMSGVIIVSEDSPYKEQIPYHEHIIWEKIENIPQKVKEVNENYDIYFDKIFGNDNLIKILSGMDEKNLKNIYEKII